MARKVRSVIEDLRKAGGHRNDDALERRRHGETTANRSGQAPARRDPHRRTAAIAVLRPKMVDCVDDSLANRRVRSLAKTRPADPAALFDDDTGGQGGLGLLLWGFATVIAVVLGYAS
jgi:hypothetical protein